MNDILAASKDKTQIIMFYSTTCPPCRMLKPILEGMAVDNDVHFIDVNQNRNLAREYAIRSVPTVFIADKGDIAGGFRGYVTKDKIEKILTQIKELPF
jgi:thioredoxin-like negative regulator of GroEL